MIARVDISSARALASTELVRTLYTSHPAAFWARARVSDARHLLMHNPLLLAEIKRYIHPKQTRQIYGGKKIAQNPLSLGNKKKEKFAKINITYSLMGFEPTLKRHPMLEIENML